MGLTSLMMRLVTFTFLLGGQDIRRLYYSLIPSYSRYNLVNILNCFDHLHEVGFTIFYEIQRTFNGYYFRRLFIGFTIFMRLKRGLVAMTSLVLLIGFYYCYEFGNIYHFYEGTGTEELKFLSSNALLITYG